MSDLSRQVYYALVRFLVKNKARVDNPRGSERFGTIIGAQTVEETRQDFANESWFIEVNQATSGGSYVMVNCEALRNNWERFEQMEYVKLLR